jgi:crotonobetainyl-CoA:carnitine CoA-transferase CaiB-like acyl-CoA transferase
VTLLDGVRVVSLNHFIMGPMGVQHLADLGAEVIAIEPLGGAFHRRWGGADRRVGGESVAFLCANRNKKSLALDLKSEEGLEITRRLIARADVLCENFRPGVLDRLGLGYEAAQALNPRLVYASASGYGSDGPYRDRPGQDLLVQAMSGLAAATGSEEDGARAVGVSAVDHHGAALLALGVVAALLARERTGRGRRVEVDLLSAALDLQMESLVAYMNGPRPTSVRSPEHMAGWMFPGPYGVYPAADGDVAISLSRTADLAKALDVPALADIPDAEAYPRRAEIARLVADATRDRLKAALLEALAAHDVWHAEVLDYEGALAHPQVRHNGTVIEARLESGEPVHLVRHAVRYDGEPLAIRLAPQPLGAQGKEILRDLGYAETDIQGLLERRIVATS